MDFFYQPWAPFLIIGIAIIIGLLLRPVF